MFGHCYQLITRNLIIDEIAIGQPFPLIITEKNESGLLKCQNTFEMGMGSALPDEPIHRIFPNFQHIYIINTVDAARSSMNH